MEIVTSGIIGCSTRKSSRLVCVYDSCSYFMIYVTVRGSYLVATVARWEWSGVGAQACLRALLFCEWWGQGGGSLFYMFLYLGPDRVYERYSCGGLHRYPESCIRYKCSTMCSTKRVVRAGTRQGITNSGSDFRRNASHCKIFTCLR